MNKFICILLILIVLLSMVACTSDSPATTGAVDIETTAAADGVFMAGYGKADITPEEFGVPMQGYSNGEARRSTGLYSYIYSIALAVRDAQGNTAIIISVDSAAVGKHITQQIHQQIEKKTGVPAENVFITSIHQHSTPSPDLTEIETSSNYRALLIKRTVQAAVDAVEDLAPAQMYGAVAKTESINFHSHYAVADGTVAGDNFGDTSAGIVGYAREHDRDMQLVKFIRDGAKDVLIAHYQGHPAMGTSAWDTNISADTPGVFRDEMEASGEYLVMYVSGAQGDVSMFTGLTENEIYSDYKQKGQMLAQYAKEAEGTYKELKTGKVQVTKMIFAAPVNHATDYLKDEAEAIDKEWYRSYNHTSAMAYSTSGEIRSIYQAHAILLRSKDPATLGIELMAVSFGDVAICGGPYEMFDENGQAIKANSPFAFTMPAHMVNDNIGYIPSQTAFDYTCYQSDICRYAAGTGELCCDAYIEMLKAQFGAQ